MLLVLVQVADMQLQYPVQDPQAKAFYEQAAVAAASMGIVVDVYAAARGYVGLQTLEPLVNSTGGALYLYPSAEEATLPQDLYRCVATSAAAAGTTGGCRVSEHSRRLEHTQLGLHTDTHGCADSQLLLALLLLPGVAAGGCPPPRRCVGCCGCARVRR